MAGRSHSESWVIPNDRELELRARIGAGWSVHTNGLGKRNAGISEEERMVILKVIQKAEMMDRTEQERVGHLIDKFDGLKDQARGNGKTECILCGDHFRFLSRSSAVCMDCNMVVCSKCYISILSPTKQVVYLCKICNMRKEVWKKSGAWFFNDLPHYAMPATSSSGRLSGSPSRENFLRKYTSNQSLTSADSMFRSQVHSSSPHSLSSSSRKGWANTTGIDSSDDEIPECSRFTKFKVKTYASSADSSLDAIPMTKTFQTAIHQPSTHLHIRHKYSPSPPPPGAIDVVTSIPSSSCTAVTSALSRTTSPISTPLPAPRPTPSSVSASASPSHHHPQVTYTKEITPHSLHSSQTSVSQLSTTESARGYDRESMHDDHYKLSPYKSSDRLQSSSLHHSAPALYESEDTSSLYEEGSFGTVNFSLLYDDEKSQFEIHVASAQLSTDDLSPGAMDPFVQLSLLPSVGKASKKRSTVKKKTNVPMWNEQFFYYGLAQSDMSSSLLKISVKNSDGLLSSTTLGEVVIPLDQLQPDTLKHYCSTALRGKSKGKHQEKNQSEELYSGQIELSLKYSPIKELLSVGIRRCSRLIPMDSNGYSDPYVKIYLKPDVARNSKRKTAVRKKTLNPVFNEMFTYSVSTMELRKKHLLVSVWDHDGFSRNDFIGSVTLSSHADRTGGEHWRKLLNDPGTELVMWHKLYQSKLPGEQGR